MPRVQVCTDCYQKHLDCEEYGRPLISEPCFFCGKEAEKMHVISLREAGKSKEKQS